MLRIDKINNCYGINGDYHISNLEFMKKTGEKKYNNAVFGINMSGKTSLVRVLKSLKDNSKITNIIQDDGIPHAEITLNNKKYTYSNGWDKQFDDQLFICDKNFLNNSITIIEKEAVIGVDVVDLKLTRENKEASMITPTDIKKFIDHEYSLNKQKDCTGYFSEIGFKGFFTQKNAHMDTILLFNAQYENSKEVKCLSDIDYEDSIDLLKKNRIDIEFINKYILDMIQNVKKEILKYKIKTYDDQEFFLSLLKYLETNKPKDCPVCLREFESDYRLEDIIKEIKLLISNHSKDDDKFKIVEEMNNIKDGKGEIQKKLYDILSNVNEGENLNSVLDELPKIVKKIHQIYETFPIYVGKNIRLKFGSQIDNYIKYSEREKELINNIKEIEGSVLIDNFMDLKKKLSLDSMKDIIAELDPNTNLIKIKLKKANLSIDSYHRDSSSEGEKSILSLLFFFAYIRTITVANKTTILIFDDPVDSHDNYNKHFIIDMIMKNLSELNVISVIFTHSSDVMRSIKMNYKYVTNFYMMSNEIKNLIFPLEHSSLEVFDGVFPFFKKVYSIKGNNIYLDMVSLLPIFRDIIEHAKTLNFGNDVSSNLVNLYKDLSNNFLHFNLKEENASMRSLFDIYRKHLLSFPYNERDLNENEPLATMNVIQFVKHRRVHRKPQVSNLVENIKFKNILGLYIRWNIESIVFVCTYDRLDETSRNSFKNDYIKWKTVSEKIQKTKEKYFDFIEEKRQKELYQLFDRLNRYKPISNDFHHQINTYITPILETSLSGLLKMCDDIDNLSVEFRKL